MNEHLPLDAFEEQHEVKGISFMWSLIFGVSAVIIPLALYLIFYFSEVESLFAPFFPFDIFFTTVAASFICPYLASVVAVFHAKKRLGVSVRGALLKHGIYVVLIPCGIGAVAFALTLGDVASGFGIVPFLSVFYIPYIILGIIISAIQSYLLTRRLAIHQ